MNCNNALITKNRNGEFICPGLNSHMNKKYKADTPLDNAVVPYIIMLICATIDLAVFLSLFKMISYDSQWMLIVQVAGMLFAFDLVPIYLGIQLRRMKQGLTKEKMVLYMALGVCAVAFIINVILNIMTIELMNPDLSSATTNYFGTAVEQTSTEGIDPSTIALTIFRIGCPVLTSVGSFFISYLTYNPLKTRKRNAEEVLAEKNDEVRRLEAVLSEYDADSEFAENLRADDEGKYEEMKKIHRALVINYCEYVRQRLKEHLADPTATNALSEETCIAILERLDRELAAIDNYGIPPTFNGNNPKDKMFISNNVAA